MRKTKAIARAALASMATAALASVSFGGTAFAWGHDEDHGNVNCSGSGNNNRTDNTAGADQFISLIPINVAAAVPIQGNGSPTSNECGND
jgi:hypothetical protein